jgi:hypothetical protein
MFRALASLGLAFFCLGSVHSGVRSNATWHEFAFLGWTPVQQKEAADALSAQPENAQKAAQYLGQQRAAEQQAETAELDLKQNIARLQQLRSKYPNSADLDRTISDLQAMLNQVIQEAGQIQQEPAAWGGGSQHSAVVTDGAVAVLAAQTNRSRQIAAEAQATAARGSEMANVTIANLARSPAAERPLPPPKVQLPRPPQTEGRPPASILPEKPPPSPDRSPASVPAEQPTTAASPDRSPVSAPEQQAPTPASPPPETPASSGSDEAAWFNKLKNGLIQYTVPGTMLWKVPSTVTVQVSGEKAAPTGPIDNQTGEGPLKVARRMKVLVSAPDNPDEFIITPESDTQLEQYVPEDGATTWHFSVTPRYTATAKKLIVQAWVMYDTNTQRELPVYKAAVDIHVPGLVECVKRLFEGDPDYWLKYGLPGGAGFIFVSAVVTGLWKWLRKKKSRTPQPAGGD